jgi:hypothetical protein
MRQQYFMGKSCKIALECWSKIILQTNASPTNQQGIWGAIVFKIGNIWRNFWLTISLFPLLRYKLNLANLLATIYSFSTS